MSQPGWDPRGKVFSMVWADRPWQQVGASYGPLASPTADANGNVFFAEPSANRIYKADPNGKVTLFLENSGGASALAMGPGDRLYASRRAIGQLVSYGPGGDEKVLAKNIQATAIAVTAQGAVYFTDAIHKTIGLVDETGRTRAADSGGEMALPTGLALSPDQAMLVVTDAEARFAWSFQIAADGSLVNGEPFYRLEMPESGWRSGMEAVAEDSIGQVYFASPVGLQMCEANGRVAMILNPPEHGAISSFTFAGKDSNWLYVTEGGKLFKRPVKVKGVTAWSLVKPPKPPL
jgi:sugar lactone lactonase YvrE